MSGLYEINRVMSEESHDPESLARLKGLMAMLALPPVRRLDGSYKRRKVEICLSDGWREVETMMIDSEWIVFSWSQPGGITERATRRFTIDRCPEWRVEQAEQVNTLPGFE